MPDDPPLEHDVFISYRTSRSPDRELAEELQRVLERFPVPRSLRGTVVRPSAGRLFASHLRVFRDVSDLSANPDLWEALRQELEASRWLLVVCSPGTAESPWVLKEIETFVAARGHDRVLAVLVEGEPDEAIPALLRERRRTVTAADGSVGEVFDVVEPLATDLRAPDLESARRLLAGRRTPRGEQKRFDVLAPLLGLASRDDLVRRHRARRRRQMRVGLAALAVVAALVGFFGYRAWTERLLRDEAELREAQAAEHAVEQSAARLVAASLEVRERNPSEAVVLAWRARGTRASEAAEEAIKAAYRVLTFRLANRRENLQITGTGAGYLAARYKEGGHFNVVSEDGRYTIYVTDRGESGPKPPGNVYLGHRETLRVLELEKPSPGKTAPRRVEFAGFDRGGERIFVTRHYDLEVYEVDGSFVAASTFSRFTKSPVHHVAGYLGGRLVLGGDGKGGLWLIDPAGDLAHEVQHEWHGDPVVDTQVAKSGERACLSFESGRSALLTLGDPERAPEVVPLAERGTLFAGFAGDAEESVLVAGREGLLEEWRLAGSSAERVRSFDGLSGDLDWARRSADGQLLLVAGRDLGVTLLDYAGGEVRERLDYADEIDWRSLRRMPRQFEPPPGRRLEVAGRQWLATRKGAFLIEEGRYLRMTEPFHAVRAIVAAGGSTWVLTGSADAPGPGYRVAGDVVETVPGRLGRVRVAVEAEGAAYLATGSGVWRFLEGAYEQVPGIEGRAGPLHSTPAGLWTVAGGKAHRIRGLEATAFPDGPDRVLGVHPRGEEAWLLTGTAAMGVPLTHGPVYLVRGDEARVVGEAGGEVRAVHFVDDETWLLTGKPAGPAYRWEGGRAVAVPDPEARIASLFAVDGRVWLLEEDAAEGAALLLVETSGVRRLPVASGRVQRIVGAAGETWVLTDAGAYRVVAGGLERLTEQPVEIVEIGGVAWLYGAGGAHRFEAGRLASYRTGEHRVVEVAEALDRLWLVTRSDLVTPGPLYRIDGDEAVAVRRSVWDLRTGPQGRAVLRVWRSGGEVEEVPLASVVPP